MRLFIIRHGDPDYSKDSLTEKGWREARLLSHRMTNERLTAIYCSPLGRARDTASPTVEATGIRPVVLDWLQEFPIPCKTDYAPQGACPWNMPPEYWSAFDGIQDAEKWKQTPLFRDSGIPQRYEEICRQFDLLLEQHGYRNRGAYYEILPGHDDDTQTIALFCHLGLGNLLLSHIAGVSLPVWWHRVFLPTSSMSMAFMERHAPDSPNALLRMVGVGDTSHLFAGQEPISASGLFTALR